MHRTRRANEGR